MWVLEPAAHPFVNLFIWITRKRTNFYRGKSGRKSIQTHRTSREAEVVVELRKAQRRAQAWRLRFEASFGNTSVPRAART